ncbi:MAG: T9SS type A sorting domain-containing protein [Bacteroidota bacterium]|jgi:hypothetical protein
MLKRNTRLFIAWLIAFILSYSSKAQLYHEVASFSYSAELLRAGTIKSNPTNPGIIYAASQNVNSNFKGFFDTYDASDFTEITRTKRLGAGVDSFGVTDFVFRNNQVYAIGSKGLQIIDITNPSTPSVVKNVKTYTDGSSTKNLGYFTASIFIQGNLMHYGGFNYVLLDIGDLNNVTKIAERSYTGINSGSIQKLDNNTVIVGDGYNVITYNVSNPQSIVKTTLSSLVGDPEDMLYDESTRVLFTTFSTSTQNFVYSVDMTSNSKLDSFNYKSVAGLNPSSHGKMCLLNDTLYIGTSSGVVLLDVSNPADLRFLGRLATGGTFGVFTNEEILVANDGNNLKFYRRGPATTTGYKSVTALKPYSMFPNPASSHIQFNVAVAREQTIFIYNMLGEIVMQQSKTLADYYSIDISALDPGSYIVKIDIDGVSYTEKLLVQ